MEPPRPFFYPGSISPPSFWQPLPSTLRPQEHDRDSRGPLELVSPCLRRSAWGRGGVAAERPATIFGLRSPTGCGVKGTRKALDCPGRPLSPKTLLEKSFQSASPPFFSKAGESCLHRQGAADSRARTVIYTLSPGAPGSAPFLSSFFPFFLVPLGEEGLFFVCVFLLQIFPGQ